MGQVTVFSGVERRRHWDDDRKRALVEASFAPGAIVAEVARAADVRPSQIYRWRRDLGGMQAEPLSFASVTVAPDRCAESGRAGAAIVIDFSGAVVRIAADAPTKLVAAVLRSLS